MTVNDQAIRQTYDAPITNGVAVPIPFSFTDSTQVKVFKTVDGVTTDLVLNSGFTVSGSNVLLVSTLSSGTLTVYRSTPTTQQTAYPESGKFPAASHEAALDKLTMQNQEQKDSIARAMRVPINTSSAFEGTLPLPVPNKAVLFNSDATGFTTSEADFDTVVSDVTDLVDDAQAAATSASNSALASSGFANDASGFAADALLSAQNAAESLANIPDMTGAISTIVNSNLTASRVMITDGNGKAAASSAVTSSELGALDGITGNIQTQLNSHHQREKLPTIANEANFSQITYIGSPTYDASTGKFTLSGSGQGLKNSNIATLGSGTWCIQGKFKFNTTNTKYRLCAGNTAYSLDFYRDTNNKLTLNIGNGSSFNIASGVAGSKANWSVSTEYYIRLRFDGSHYYVDWSTDYNPSTDTGTWTNDISISSTSTIVTNIGTLYFGINDGGTMPLAGIIGDLKVTIAGVTVFNTASDYHGFYAIATTAGYCYDSTDAFFGVCSAMTKRLDANWVAGTNQGGLDTGSKANSTWYAFFEIWKADGTNDKLFSLSETNPTMPTDYIYKRRIGWIKTDASGIIILFIQTGDLFEYKNKIQDYISNSLVGTFTDLTLSVPPSTRAILMTYLNSSNNQYAYLTLGIKSKITNNCITMAVSPYGPSYTSYFEINVDSASKVQYQSAASGGDTYVISIHTVGYKDTRGKN